MLVLNLLNKIFGGKGGLSRKDINDYIKGGTNDNEIEKKSQEDDFNNDALEGFSSQDLDMSAMSELDNKISKKYSSNAKSNLLIIAASIVVILGTVAYFQFFQPVESNYELAVNEIEYKKVEAKIDENSEDEMEHAEQLESVESSDVIQQEGEKQISTHEIIEKQEDYAPLEEVVKNSQNKRNQQRGAQPFPQAETDNVRSVKLPPKRSDIPTVSEETTSGLNYKVVEEIYLSDYKLVDYRNFRDGQRIENEELIGTPASHESPEGREEAFLNINDDNSVAYIDFMEDAMRVLSSKDYIRALNKFKTVLKTYPDDVNANFYAGYANFHLKNFDESIEYFKNSYSITFGNFREEARFLMAKSYLGLNNTDKANKILKSIVKEDGFYSKDAKALLNN